jgi:hypothetical protein
LVDSFPSSPEEVAYWTRAGAYRWHGDSSWGDDWVSAPKGNSALTFVLKGSDWVLMGTRSKARLSLKKNHDEACYLLGETVKTIFDEVAALENNYKYVEKAVRHSSGSIVLEEVEQYRQMSTVPAFARYFEANRQEFADGSYRTRVSGVIISSLEKTLRRTAAASLTFGHSVFESCVYNLLRITVEAGPEDWLPVIARKQVSASELTTKNSSELLLDLVQGTLRALERESVLTKIERLFAVVSPPANRRKFPAYTYDPARIEEIDLMRHKVVHDDPVCYDPLRLHDDLHYLLVTWLWLSAPMLDKYDLQSKPRPILPIAVN